MITERLWARMGRRSVSIPGAEQLPAELARSGVTTRPETTLPLGLAEKLANEAAFQALQEARALAAEAQQERIAAEAAWREAHRIQAELAAASAAHAARSAELDSRADLIETRERELDKMLQDIAALKTEYESKLAAIEAIVKGSAAPRVLGVMPVVEPQLFPEGTKKQQAKRNTGS
jgi:hypothetical protein